MTKKQKLAYEIDHTVPFIPPQYWMAGNANPPAAVGTYVPIGNNAFPVVDCVLTVDHAQRIGCTEATATRELLYFRQKTLDLYNFLNSSLNAGSRLVEMNGPPGCGKSLSVIAFVSHKMSAPTIANGDGALFYNLVTHRTTLIHRRANATVVSRITNINDLVDIAKHRNLLYVILDGAKPANQGYSLVDEFIDMSTASVIYISSMGSSLPGVLKKYGPRYYVEPWLYTDYESAINDTPLFQEHVGNLMSDDAIDALNRSNTPITNHTRADLIAPGFAWTADMKAYVLREKFVIGGHSARWMFCKPTHVVLEDIAGYVAKVANAETLLKGLTQEVAKDFVNHLFCTFQSPTIHRSFTSEFVGRQLVRICTTQIIRSITSFCVAGTNPSLDGIVLEIDVLHCLREGTLDNHVWLYTAAVPAVTATATTPAVAGIPASFYPVNLRYNVQPTDVFSFQRLSNWTGPSTAVNITPAGMAYVPEEFNNGGFDFVVLRRNNQNQVCAEFVQVTRANQHDLEIFFMHTFINAYNGSNNVSPANLIAHAKITILNPTNTVANFVPPTHARVIGTLVAYNWQLVNLEIIAFTRTV